MALYLDTRYCNSSEMQTRLLLFVYPVLGWRLLARCRSYLLYCSLLEYNEKLYHCQASYWYMYFSGAGNNAIDYIPIHLMVGTQKKNHSRYNQPFRLAQLLFSNNKLYYLQM